MYTYLGQLQPIAHVIRWKDDRLCSRAPSRDRLLAQAANAQDFARDREFAGHGNGRVEGLVEREGEQGASHGDTGRGT